jgi:hypothetical protein
MQGGSVLIPVVLQAPAHVGQLRSAVGGGKECH